MSAAAAAADRPPPYAPRTYEQGYSVIYGPQTTIPIERAAFGRIYSYAPPSYTEATADATAAAPSAPPEEAVAPSPDHINPQSMVYLTPTDDTDPANSTKFYKVLNFILRRSFDQTERVRETERLPRAQRRRPVIFVDRSFHIYNYPHYSASHCCPSNLFSKADTCKQKKGDSQETAMIVALIAATFVFCYSAYQSYKYYLSFRAIRQNVAETKEMQQITRTAAAARPAESVDEIVLQDPLTLLAQNQLRVDTITRNRIRAYLALYIGAIGSSITVMAGTVTFLAGAATIPVSVTVGSVALVAIGVTFLATYIYYSKKEPELQQLATSIHRNQKYITRLIALSNSDSPYSNCLFKTRTQCLREGIAISRNIINNDEAWDSLRRIHRLDTLPERTA